MEERTTISVQKDTRDKLMLFKIKAKARDLDAVIRSVIEKLKIKEELKVEENSSSAL